MSYARSCAGEAWLCPRCGIRIPVTGLPVGWPMCGCAGRQMHLVVDCGDFLLLVIREPR